MGSQVPGTTIHSQSHSYSRADTNYPTTQLAATHIPAMALQQSMGKATVASAYPSPADEIKHTITPSSPAQSLQRAPSADAEKSLPSLREVLQRPMSPSTSPHMTPLPFNATPGSLPMHTPMSRDTSGNPYAGNFHQTADPQLFPDETAAVAMAYQQPLFHLPINNTARGRTSFQVGEPRRRKRTPHQTPQSHKLEPPRRALSMHVMAMADPLQWFDDRRKEDDQYWPSASSTPRTPGIEMSRGSSSQGLAMSANKRNISRQDSGAQIVPSKRPRVVRGDGHAVTRSSPREATSSYFNTVLVDAPEPFIKLAKPAVKQSTTAAPPAKKIKPNPEEPDVAYNLYRDTCPDVSTLDKGLKFSANWAGKPLNLDNDPNRGLLHAEEIRLASKLALTCARYLYLKRRFYAGRLEFARRSQLYNINAAQQQCKGQDMYGVVGADVNKTSSMWKAFNSVGWLEAAHMQRFL